MLEVDRLRYLRVVLVLAGLAGLALYPLMLAQTLSGTLLRSAINSCAGELFDAYA